MEVATWAVVGATLLLVAVTAAYAVHTWRIAQKTAEAARSAVQSAAAAERSAKAAEQMVDIERERLWDEDRPDLTVHMQSIALVSTVHKAKCEILIRNDGKGPAEGIEMFGLVGSEGRFEYCAAGKKVADSLGAGGGDGVEFLVPPAVAADPPYHLIFICHYVDIHQGPETGRVYHSVFDNKAQPPYRSYRPGQIVPDTYRRACRVCRSTDA